LNLYHKIYIAAAAAALIILAACSDSANRQPEVVATPDSSQGWYSIYFTDPLDPQADSYRGGPDDALGTAIDQARVSVDLAVLELNLWRIRDALIDAHKRGIQVRVVTERDNLYLDEIQDLIDAGIPVSSDLGEGLMHNKFTVIDRQEVWTGSMNFTTTDGYRNDNNLLRIQSAQIAENYTSEFEEMFIEDLYGADIRAATPNPETMVEGTKVETFFSPDDQTARRLLALIDSAEESVYFMAFSFTSDDLADAIIRRSRAGVEVAGVMDQSQVASNQGGEYERFRDAGLDVRQDGNPNKMHHKVLIIDEAIVVTGSYNFTASAEKYNDENTLILYNKDIASRYLDAFDLIYKLAER